MFLQYLSSARSVAVIYITSGRMMMDTVIQCAFVGKKILRGLSIKWLNKSNINRKLITTRTFFY